MEQQLVRWGDYWETNAIIGDCWQQWIIDEYWTTIDTSGRLWATIASIAQWLGGYFIEDEIAGTVFGAIIDTCILRQIIWRRQAHDMWSTWGMHWKASRTWGRRLHLLRHGVLRAYECSRESLLEMGTESNTCSIAIDEEIDWLIHNTMVIQVPYGPGGLQPDGNGPRIKQLIYVANEEIDW